jgi:serine/threonine protein kinase
MEENKIVHRDIKPSNIMINSKKEVKLADLGIAKVDSSTFEGELTLTQDNLVFGTPDYASPEQCRSSHNTDSRSDIYSLGATMFYMVTGVPPFRGENAMDTIVKVINEPLPDILQLEPNISSEFKQLINDMMAKSPTNRPQTITELQTRIFQVIESIQSNESIDTTLNNNSLKTLNSFLHKIDRLSLIKNWNLNETETMSNTGVNLLTKFCKITGIVILILGFLSFICIVTGIKIDKRIAAIFQKQKNNITNSLPIQKIAYTSKNALTKLPPNYNSSKIAVKKDKAKTSDSAKST